MTSDKLAIQTKSTKYAYMKPQNKNFTPSLSTEINNNNPDKPLPTPPSSPEVVSRAPMQYTNRKKTSSTYEYNNRILAAKRNGNIRLVMSEYMSMKKNSVQMTHHTYNLVLEAHAILRREGTPLTTMMKSKLNYNYSVIHQKEIKKID